MSNAIGEMHLQGRFQIETVVHALGFTGVNPDFQKTLEFHLGIYQGMTSDEQDTYDGLSLRLIAGDEPGDVDEVETCKSEIATSLAALEMGGAEPELRIAAGALREIFS